MSFLETVLDAAAPSLTNQPPRPSACRDELFLYLDEKHTALGVLDYWKPRERRWPNLARIAFDLLAVPAMSSECERVFSSCAKQTTPQSSRLSGKLLWHQECLKSWQGRSAIEMAQAWDGILLDLRGYITTLFLSTTYQWLISL
jgi:hAT family C-terminal dimerisation region